MNGDRDKIEKAHQKRIQTEKGADEKCQRTKKYKMQKGNKRIRGMKRNKLRLKRKIKRRRKETKETQRK